jgi:cytochrome c556
MSMATGAAAVLTVVVSAASPEDGKAAFQKREDTMKHMGRPFYLGISRVVKGTAAYSPDTVTAAETVASLATDRHSRSVSGDVVERPLVWHTK